MMANNSLKEYEEKFQLQDKQAYDYLEGLKQKVAKLTSDLHVPVKKFLLVENSSLKLEIEAMRKKLTNGEAQPIQLMESTEAAPDVSQVSENVDSNKKPEVVKSLVKKEKSKKENKPKKEPETSLPVDVGLLDFRVGKIISVEKHPNADSLYIEQINIAEESPRTVISGLVNYYKIEELRDQMVVLLCNLKPVTMRGVKSHAMVMCASSPEKVEFLRPPESCVPGDVIEFEGYERRPESVLNPKKKVFETCASDLKTDSNGIPTYKGKPFTIKDKGCLIASSLYDVQIK